MSFIRHTVKWAAGALGVAAAGYAGYVGLAWLQYGRAPKPLLDEADPLLDRFMPVYDVAERHHVRVDAPAAITVSAACDQDLMASPIVRAIFKAREVVLGADPDTRQRPRPLVALTKSLGWAVLAETPGREIVMGAVTQPWNANVVFRPLPSEEFAAFAEPEFVKIAWTLRADPIDNHRSIFRTETRVTTTDAAARSKFRWYWARFSAGIAMIRWLSLGPLRREAERRDAALHH